MQIKTRKIENNGTAEVYITAVPALDSDIARQGRKLFEGIRAVLEETGAAIIQERVFGTSKALELLGPLRSEIYGEMDDGVEPTWLVVPEGINGHISGIQVYGVKSMEKPEVILSDEQPCGRILSFGQDKLLSISGICPAKESDPSTQADQMLAKTESVLNQCGADMFSVARTWMWLRDILSWYDDFNKVRNSFFVERGLIGNGGAKMPASTGIGIGPVNGGICTMDLISVLGPKSSIEYLDTTGMQSSAFDYGSAFSRATKMQTPACKTVFVSGTASIDADGATIHVGDAVAQIQTTFDNIETVLKEMGCAVGDIAHAILYCKTAEIEQVIHSQWSNLDWPFFTAITDVCRDDLLFEIEVTAISA